VPGLITALQGIDGFLEVGLPPWYVSTVLFLAAATYLLFRRLVRAQVRYISLPADYFPLFLLLGIGLSGLTLRHLLHTDVAAIKELTAGLVSFRPVVPDGISPLFFGHLFLVSVLLAYFPFSKLVHLGAIFVSPTRALANNNRAVRHVNEWDYPVAVHSYDEYEDELREKMVGAGIPVERESA
jgi:nitrate reductase gamma subunit